MQQNKLFGKVFLISLVLIGLMASMYPATHPKATEPFVAGDLAWMLAASGLVLLMTPGLSFFYGGMVRAKNMLSTMLQSFIALGVVSILWYAVGFSLAFGDSLGGWIGNPLSFTFFNNVGTAPHPRIGSTLPFILFAAFQLKFAIITPALITGSMAERIRFWSYVVMMVLFSLLIYCPLAHWTWHPEGILFQMGVLDFAGGTVVHISAGVTALIGAWILGPRRKNLPQIDQGPNASYVILGTGLLWFGWFGFNAGSALGANTLAVEAFLNTHLASASAMLAWLLFDLALGRRPTATNACIGAVVGLVAITPAAGFVSYGPSIFIGIVSALISNLAVQRFQRSAKIDDSLDVFACHGLGGISGMLLTALFAREGGLLLTGSFDLLLAHLKGLALVLIFCSVGGYLVLKLTNLIIPLRVNENQEHWGLDPSMHGECLPV
jgi:Amt family ammonium transporter